MENIGRKRVRKKVGFVTAYEKCERELSKFSFRRLEKI